MFIVNNHTDYKQRLLLLLLIHIHFNSRIMQGQSCPERVEFISVPVCHSSSCPIRDLKGFALSSTFDSKTFPSYSSSALYVAVPGFYISIILLDFFNYTKN